MWQTGVLVRNIDNPDFGPGRVRGRDSNGILSVRFPWSSTEGHFDPTRSPIERYKLFGSTPVQCKLEGIEKPLPGFVIGEIDQGLDMEILSYREGLAYSGLQLRGVCNRQLITRN